MKGTLIKTYDTIVEASKIPMFDRQIVGVCKGVCSQSHNLVWKYVNDNPNEKYVDLEKEGFKQLKTFPNYWINNKGQVYSKPFKKFMKLENIKQDHYNFN